MFHGLQVFPGKCVADDCYPVKCLRLFLSSVPLTPPFSKPDLFHLYASPPLSSGLNLSSPSCLPLPFFPPQAARDEGYEVDEDLAQQDAMSLFEVEFTDVIRAAPLLNIRGLVQTSVFSLPRCLQSNVILDLCG